MQNFDGKSPFDLAIDSKCKALLEITKRVDKDYLGDEETEEDGNISDD
jgi:hypothetical protein